MLKLRKLRMRFNKLPIAFSKRVNGVEIALISKPLAFFKINLRSSNRRLYLEFFLSFPFSLSDFKEPDISSRIFLNTKKEDDAVNDA